MLFRVLGPLEVHRPDGRPVDSMPDTQVRLLALLVANGNDWVTAELAADAMWPAEASPDGPPPDAETVIRTSIHLLRQALPRTPDGTPRLNSRAGSHRLNLEPDEVDAGVLEILASQASTALSIGDPDVAVERGRAALALWRGRPFEPLEPRFTASWDDTLADLRRAATDALADGLLASGRADEAVARLRELTADDPAREDAWERLVTALDRVGEQGQALVAYEHARQALAAAGREPGPRLVAAHERVTAGGDRTVRITAAEAAAMARSRPARADDPPPLPPQQIRAPGETLAPEQWLPPTNGGGRTLPRVLVAVVVVAALVAAVVWWRSSDDPQGIADPAPTGQRATQTVPAPAEPLPAGVPPRRDIPGLLVPDGNPSVLFGVGPAADAALAGGLARDSRTRLLTTTYSSADDPLRLAELATWQSTVAPRAYGEGFALHLVVVDASEPVASTTPEGAVCGKPYGLSAEFLADVQLLATAFAGPADGPPLYVTLLQDVETAACTPGTYEVDEATKRYYDALLAQYTRARDIVHRTAANARVAIGWEAAVVRFDDPAIGGGRSMIERFSQVLDWSDFTSVRARRPDGNADDVRAAVAELGRHAPVLVTYEPPPDPATVQADVAELLTRDSLAGLAGDGLLGITFVDEAALRADEATARVVIDTIGAFGRDAR